MTRRAGRHSCLKIFLLAAAGGLALCLALAGISALANRGLFARSEEAGRLSKADKARAAELLHLKEQRGGLVMPGWQEADIPLIFYNEAYAFLLGFPNPPDGWVTVPRGDSRGAAWEPVADDDFMGQTYYRQRLSGGESPQNFTVRVGERYAASLMTMGYFKLSLASQFRQDLPRPLAAVFPYTLVVSQFVPSSEFYGAAVLHEAMHAFQGIAAGERLANGERANSQWSGSYPWDDNNLRQGWQAELDLLNNSLRAKDDAEMIELARRFLQHREQRRQAAALSDGLIDFERQREWVEGIAKYAELAAFQQGASAGYRPVNDRQVDPHFKSYAGFQTRWNNELSQMRRMAGDAGDGRFYYTGWAQAVILDRLAPGWKARLFEEGVWLEDLLAEAVR